MSGSDSTSDTKAPRREPQAQPQRGQPDQPPDENPAEPAPAAPPARATSTDRAEDEELSPELIAQLAAWFGPGPPPDAAEAAAAGADRTGVQTDDDAARRALAAVDAGLLARLEAQGSRAGAVVSLPPPPPPPVDTTIARFRLERWNLVGREPRELEPDERVRAALNQRTPQAILRDLHRPVKQFGGVFLRQVDLGVDTGGRRARARVRDAMARRYAVRIDDEPIPRRFVREDWNALRAVLAAPWQDSLPQQAATPASEVPGVEDMRWFGTGGFDPDQ